MKMKVLLKTAFSILDGRLSTEMKDIYEMLNYIFSDNLMTHQLPTAMRNIKTINPTWFKDGVDLIQSIKDKHNTNDFKELINIIDKDYSEHYIRLGKIDKDINFTAGL